MLRFLQCIHALPGVPSPAVTADRCAASLAGFLLVARHVSTLMQRDYRHAAKCLRISPRAWGGVPLRAPPQRAHQGVSPFIIAGNKKGNFVNKIALSLMTSVLAPLALASAPAQAETWCVHFSGFCDGLQLSTTDSPLITGTWENWDCGGSQATISGSFLVNDGSRYRVVCSGSDSNCPSAEQWLFSLTAFQLGFTFDLVQLNPNVVFLIDSPYSVTPGACSLAGSESSTPSWLK
jgi:hypothetical protein